MVLRVNHALMASVLFIICCSFTGDVPSTPPNKIVFNKLRGAYLPFSYIKSTSIEVRNNKLHFLALDKNGDMLQIKDIPIDQVRNGILPPSGFRTVFISNKYGTSHDDGDTNPNSLLEIKCSDNKPGNTITIGIKTTLQINQKNVRVYATLSGIIPSYIYTEQH